MQPSDAGVRLALLVITKCPVLHQFRESAEQVLADAAVGGGDYAAIHVAYKAMLAARAEVRRAGKAFDANAREHGNPMWSGTVNHGYTEGLQKASVAYDDAREQRDRCDRDFYRLAQAFIHRQ